MKKQFLFLAFLFSSILSFGQANTTNFKGDIITSGDLKYNFIHGLIYKTAAAYTPNITQNVHFKLVPGMTVAEADGITIAGDSITILTAGDYFFQLATAVSSSAGKDFQIALFKNGSPYNGSQLFLSTSGANDYESNDWFWYSFTSVSGDNYSFHLTGLTDNTDLTISEIKIYVAKIPEN